MTREDALKILKSWDGYMFLEREEGNVGYSYKREVSQEAVYTAIKALQNERPQGDLIRRSEAKKLGATCLAKRNENGQLEAIISLENVPTVDLWKMRQEATENALKKAEMLYGRPQGEWIPVSERLPEQNGVYITTCRDICENRVHTVGFDGVRKKWGRGGVIAWQPLPEPYKKESEEE